MDLEQGEVVDILPDRTAESLEAWLKAHPGVEIVSRDRAGAYAQGARQGAPDAVQIADRWHLLKNLTDAIYKVLQKYRSAIERELARRQGANGVENKPAGLESCHTYTDLAQPSASDLARQQRQQDAHRYHEQGWTNRAITTQIGVCPKTVSRYLNAELPSAPLRRWRRRQLLDPYRAYMIERWNAGCHNAAQLCREIQAQGYAGQYSIVRHFAGTLREKSGLPPRLRSATGKTVRQDPSLRPLTLRTLAHLVGRPQDKLDENEREYIDRLRSIHPRLQTVVELATDFATMVCHRQAENLDLWLAKARSSALSRFVAGLKRDYPAVFAALSLPRQMDPQRVISTD